MRNFQAAQGPLKSLKFTQKSFLKEVQAEKITKHAMGDHCCVLQFGTDFKARGYGEAPSRCSVGVEASRTSAARLLFTDDGIKKAFSPIILDLEGADGPEQASTGTITLERQLLLLALRVSDAVIINTSCEMLSLHSGGLWDSLMNALKVTPSPLSIYSSRI